MKKSSVIFILIICIIITPFAQAFANGNDMFYYKFTLTSPNMIKYITGEGLGLRYKSYGEYTDTGDILWSEEIDIFQFEKNNDNCFCEFTVSKVSDIKLTATHGTKYVYHIIYDEAGNQVRITTPYWDNAKGQIVTNEVFTLNKGTYRLTIREYESDLPEIGTVESHIMLLQIGSPDISIDGEVRKIDSERTTPVIINGRTMLPIRAIIETMGGSVVWNNSTKTVSLTKDGKQLHLRIGTSYAWDNNVDLYPLDSAPVIINGRTLLPVRVVVEYFNGIVEWESSTKTVVIKYETQR